MAEWLTVLGDFLGRLHPLVVHFPIALIIVAAFAELFGVVRRSADAHRFGRFAFAIGAAGAVVASGVGWLLAEYSESQGEPGGTLFWHRWLGIALAVVSVTAALLIRGDLSLSKKRQLAYRSSLLVCLFLVTVTGHLGGQMVHGEDYLVQPLLAFTDQKEGRARLKDSDLAKLPAPAQKSVSYSKDVHPVFAATCYKCHGDGMHKGGLRMDSRELLLKGGESGPAIVPGKSTESLLVHLIAGLEPKRIMPSKGRRLTTDEIALVRAWIDQGAKWDGSDTPKKSDHFVKASVLPRPVDLPPLSKTTTFSHPVDRILEPVARANGIDLGNVVDDRTYLRRVMLDIIGLQPTAEEFSKFEADNRKDKRERIINTLLEQRHHYATHWLSFWSDLLRNDYTGAGFIHGGRKEITDWLYRSLLTNTPYNRMVFDLTTQSKGAEGFLAGVRWWHGDQVDISEHVAMQGAQNIAQLFMGVNLKCASCHDSFTDAWKLEDSYGLANVFTKKPLETHVCNFPTGVVIAPRFIYPELGTIIGQKINERRYSLGTLLTHEKNGRFARTIVNRMWARFFGYGIVNPIDELDHTPWNADLLDWLANDFVAHQYDLSHLIRRLATSRAYQLPSVPNPETVKEPFIFRGPFVRRLTAEQFLDSVTTRFRVWPDTNVKDMQRVVRLTRAAKDVPVLGADEPRVRFESERISFSSPNEAKIKTDLGGSKNLWIAVYPDYKYREKRSRALERKARMREAAEERAGKPPTIYEDEKVVFQNVSVTFSNGRTATLAELSPERVISSGVPIAPISALFPKGVSEVRIPLRRKFGESPFLAIGFRAPEGTAVKSIQGTVQIVDIPKKGDRAYRVLVLTDLEIRSALLEATDLLLALGRPRREQIATSRESVATMLQAMELMQRPEYNGLIARVSEVILKDTAGKKTPDVARHVFSSILGRVPSAEELRVGLEFLGEKPTREQIADYVWALTLLPEFQLLT